MLAFMAIQTINRLQKTERETVSAFGRNVSESATVAAAAAATVETIPELEPVPDDQYSSATVVRRLLLAQLKTAGKLGSKAPTRECVLTIGPDSAELLTFTSETFLMHVWTLQTSNKTRNRFPFRFPTGNCLKCLGS